MSRNPILSTGPILGAQVTETFNYYEPVDRLYHPDPQHPVQITVWKKGPLEPLLKGGKYFYLVPNGKDYYFNLRTSQVTDEAQGAGDLMISITRPLDHGHNEKASWSCAIRVPQGGIVQTDDTFLYRAPESGYADVWNFSMDKDSPQWIWTTRRRFYVVYRSTPLYAALEVEIEPFDRDRASIQLNFVANPAGSRNLEYDNATQIVNH